MAGNAADELFVPRTPLLTQAQEGQQHSSLDHELINLVQPPPRSASSWSPVSGTSDTSSSNSISNGTSDSSNSSSSSNAGCTGSVGGGHSPEGAALASQLCVFKVDDFVFPGMRRRFYIFEPRYRALVKRCLRDGQPMLLLPSVSAGNAVGTAAWVTGLYNVQEDGRYVLVQCI